MMKNFTRIMALMLCLLLVFPAALAEEPVRIIGGPDAEGYIVGEPTSEVFGDAFAAGKLVSGTVELDLELNAEVLGVPAEEAETVQAVLDAIAQSKLTFGAGMTGEGLRIALGAEMTDAAGANPVGVTALADVTPDGVSVESDLIAGKRLSVKWETLLALAGMSQTDIDQIMSLKELDPAMIEQMIAELLTELEPVIEKAAQMAAPYMETIGSFVMTLPIEVNENLNEEDYPPTATEISITVTEQDLGKLITLLCDQLEQDNTMYVFIKSLLEEMDAGVTIDEALAQAREAAAQMTDTDTPITFYLGMNENGVPMYVEAYVCDEPSGEGFYAGLFLYQDADGVWMAEIPVGLYDAENNPIATIYLGGSYQEDPADPNVCSLLAEAYVYDADTPMVEMVMTLNNVKATDTELPAYDTDMAMSMYVNDGETEVQTVSSANARQGLTASGGESSITSTTTDVYMGDAVITQTETVEQVIDRTANDGVTGYTKVTETMPASGVERLDLVITYASEDIDLAASKALEQIAIEDATNDQMNALLTEVMTVLTEEKLPGLMAVLPAPVLDLVMAEFAAE